MASTLRRFSDPSATCLMRSGRLLRPAHPGLPSALSWKPNFVAITTPPPKGKQRFPHQLFVGKWSVDLGRVEEGDTTVHRCMKKRDHLRLVANRFIPKGHSHAAEPEGGDLQI